MKNQTCRDAQAQEDWRFSVWGAMEGCPGTLLPAPGGGIKCDTCSGWFCY